MTSDADAVLRPCTDALNLRQLSDDKIVEAIVGKPFRLSDPYGLILYVGAASYSADGYYIYGHRTRQSVPYSISNGEIIIHRTGPNAIPERTSVVMDQADRVYFASRCANGFSLLAEFSEIK